MKNTPRPFTHVDTWVFDLDNTLYPHHVNLWQQVDQRIGEFVSAWLKVSAEEARRRFAQQPFKLDLINEFAKDGKQLTIYHTGGTGASDAVFSDLCRGGNRIGGQRASPPRRLAVLHGYSDFHVGVWNSGNIVLALHDSLRRHGQ